MVAAEFPFPSCVRNMVNQTENLIIWMKNGGGGGCENSIENVDLAINILSEKTYIVYNWSFISPPDKLKVTYMSDAD